MSNQRTCPECNQPMLAPGQERQHEDDYRHASGCSKAPCISLSGVFQTIAAAPVRSSELLADSLMEIVKRANHGIPFYAYSDNEAACDMSHRLEEVTKMAEAMRDQVIKAESANKEVSGER